MEYSMGQKASMSKIFSDEDVKTFSNISLDKNPVHLNDDYARKSIFKERIVHGLLVSSLISAVIANKLPGHGSIYLCQELNFRHPVFIGDEIQAIVEIIDLNTVKKKFKLKTICINRNDQIVIDGYAIVIMK